MSALTTVTGSFDTPSSSPATGLSVVFEIIGAPYIFGAAIVTSSPVTATTDVDGQISLSLLPGSYRVTVGSTNAFNILVPDDGGTYDLLTIITSPLQSIQNGDSSQIWNVNKLQSVLQNTKSVKWWRNGDPDEPAIRVGLVGNIGNLTDDTLHNASQLASLSPTYILSTGDESFDPSTIPYSGADTIYSGICGTGNFFPCIGDRDAHSIVGTGYSYSEYLAYFNTAPLTSRYYKTTIGAADVFVLNSDKNEPDGYTATSVQGQWLQAQLAASTAKHKIVMCHHSPYSAQDGYTETWMRWPFALWGATMVVSSHANTFEVHLVDNIVYLVVGSCNTTLGTISSPGSDPTLFLYYTASQVIAYLDVNSWGIRITALNAIGESVYSGQYVLSPNLASALFPEVLTDPSSPISVGSNGLKLRQGSGINDVPTNMPYDFTTADIIISATAPDVLANPRAAYSLWCKPGKNAIFSSWDREARTWGNITGSLSYTQTLTQLAQVGFSPGGGNATEVTITGISSGATAYYSLNGAAFQVYTPGTSIAFPYTATSKVIAAFQTKSGSIDSDVNVAGFI